jgi:hypothetical protein
MRWHINLAHHARHSGHQPEKPSTDVELIPNHAVLSCLSNELSELIRSKF